MYRELALEGALCTACIERINFSQQATLVVDEGGKALNLELRFSWTGQMMQETHRHKSLSFLP
ncbi:hypothetical protein ALFP_2373 [Alcaligenes faecalis]|nr:hypothetical protein ALFP_2373 [Alcaligenes faecalis]